MKSIQSRLATGLLISLISVFGLLWFIVSSNIQQLAEEYIASRLEHDIETLITATQFTDNQLLFDDRRIDTVYQRPFSGHYFLIQHNNTVIRSRSLWDQQLHVADTQDYGLDRSYQQGPEQQRLLVISGRFRKHEQDIIISVAEDLSPVQQNIQQFKRSFGLAALFFLLALILIQIILLRRQLKPLRNMREELNKLEQGQIAELSANNLYEIKPVIDDINHLSRSLHQRLKRSRSALSDLSHAIKKPLTVLQQFFDRQPTELDAESRKLIQQQVTDIQLLTERILKRARVAGASQFHQSFPLNEDLTLLIRTIASLYPDKQIQHQLKIDNNIELQLDREDLLELLGNLLDNAWKWAQNQVDIEIRKNNKLYICIEDDGAGADDEALNTLAQRGLRLDESVEGHGFGLAIVADIVKDYNGSLKFQRSEKLGGFKALVELPLNQ